MAKKPWQIEAAKKAWKKRYQNKKWRVYYKYGKPPIGGMEIIEAKDKKTARQRMMKKLSRFPNAKVLRIVER